jgi:hypothetical protein
MSLSKKKRSTHQTDIQDSEQADIKTGIKTISPSVHSGCHPTVDHSPLGFAVMSLSTNVRISTGKKRKKKPE